MRQLFLAMKALLASIFLLFSLGSHAQNAIGIKGFKYFVSENTAPQLGNTISGELFFSIPVTDNNLVVARGGIIYINHKIRFDTIPNYLVEYVGNQVTVFPGTLVQKKFDEFQVAIGADLNFLNFDKFQAYLGADVLAGSYDSVYDSKNKRYSKSETASGAILGFRVRVGASYMVNNWLEPFIEISYYGKRYYGIADLSAMDYGFGLKFWINGKD
ncbi:hypothetical protein G3O08_10600 [Cryomorpha ignava]|uniref:Outer membrane protein beta-barrel domain-containing protein n=1 Tax=Cryomorpha ignava TaxID=101383 RepID=A0A7K3WQZ1_9FLAO|nr:hypothetical protein [Cryomorpha ignava]NEN23948.1 hypothetical protein [Cryomorpha ignava]